MRMDVHSSEIGDESLIPKLLNIKNEESLELLLCVAVSLGPQKNSKLQRHVESREVVHFIKFSPGQVMYAIAAFLD